jgi:hypothetical protein
MSPLSKIQYRDEAIGRMKAELEFDSLKQYIFVSSPQPPYQFWDNPRFSSNGYMTEANVIRA